MPCHCFQGLQSLVTALTGSLIAFLSVSLPLTHSSNADHFNAAATGCGLCHRKERVCRLTCSSFCAWSRTVPPSAGRAVTHEEHFCTVTGTCSEIAQIWEEWQPRQPALPGLGDGAANLLMEASSAVLFCGWLLTTFFPPPVISLRAFISSVSWGCSKAS